MRSQARLSEGDGIVIEDGERNRRSRGGIGVQLSVFELDVIFSDGSENFHKGELLL